MEDPEKTAVLAFKALGDPNRIHILKMLRKGETCTCKLLEELNVSQPTLSHHMKILCDAQLVTGRKEGKWVHYSLNFQGIRYLQQMLQEIISPQNIQGGVL